MRELTPALLACSLHSRSSFCRCCSASGSGRHVSPRSSAGKDVSPTCHSKGTRKTQGPWAGAQVVRARATQPERRCRAQARSSETRGEAAAPAAPQADRGGLQHRQLGVPRDAARCQHCPAPAQQLTLPKSERSAGSSTVMISSVSFCRTRDLAARAGAGQGRVGWAQHAVDSAYAAVWPQAVRGTSLLRGKGTGAQGGGCGRDESLHEVGIASSDLVGCSSDSAAAAGVGQEGRSAVRSMMATSSLPFGSAQDLESRAGPGEHWVPAPCPLTCPQQRVLADRGVVHGNHELGHGGLLGCEGGACMRREMCDKSFTNLS